MMIFIIIYISLTIKKKTAIVSWPITFLRIVTESLCSFLYIPIIELFLVVFKCKNVGSEVFH